MQNLCIDIVNQLFDILVYKKNAVSQKLKPPHVANETNY